MLRKLNIVILFLAVLFGMGVQLHAQVREDQKNIMQVKDPNWKFIQSQNFRIHYYTQDPAIADLGARIAEEAFYDLSNVLDYKPRSKYAIHIFMDENDLIHSNQYADWKHKDAGVTPLQSNSGEVAYTGNLSEFQQNIKSEVARLIMRDFYFAGSIQSSIQRTVLLHMPKWYLEGFSAYLGEGWSYEDEKWIASLENEDLMEYAVEGKGHIHHIVRKSIWYYVAQEFGDDKLAEIFYMTRVTRSVEVAFIKVWGIPLKSLTNRWQEFMKKRIAENQEYRDEIDKKATQVDLNSKDRLLGFAMNPVEPTVALYLDQGGVQRITLLDLQSNKITETGIKGGFRSDQVGRFQFDMPMAWSHNGQYLAGTIYKGGYEKVYYYDKLSGNHNLNAVNPVLEKVLSLSFSHDNRTLITSGLAAGNINLYTLKPGTNQFREVFPSKYDFLDPVYSLDDRSILFSSNYQAGDVEKEADQFLRYRKDLDLFRLDLDDKASGPQAITQTPKHNERSPLPLSSFEVAFISDEIGIHNLKKQNIFVGESNFLTNLSNGIHRANLNDSLIVFSSPVKGELGLFYTPVSGFLGEYPTLPETKLKYLKQKELERAEDIRKKQEEADQERIQKEKEAQERENARAKDTTKTEKPKFYVFDEGDEVDDKPTKRKLFKPRKLTRFKQKEQRPDFDTIPMRPPTKAKTEWSSDYVKTVFGFDPIWRLYMDFGVGFTDTKKNHRIDMNFRPYWNLKSSDIDISYQYNKPKIDLGTNLRLSSRFLNKHDYLIRYNYITAEGYARYPLSRYSGLQLSHDFTFIKRFDLNPLDEQFLDGTDNLSRLRLQYTLDRTKKKLNYTSSGYSVNAEVGSAYSYNTGTLNFSTAKFDARSYLPVKSHVVLATRLTGGASLGNNPQTFLMGGTPDWLFGGFQNPEDLPIDGEISAFRYTEYVTPIRGFLFNGRNGTKYVSANAELRIPISRSITSSLNSNPIYNVEVIPFYDIGTIWVTGNPLSQKNPINTNIIDQYPLLIKVQTLKSPFIMGFGTGVRTLLLGYSVRFDMAWGVEDNTVLKPKLHLSLGKNF